MLNSTNKKWQLIAVTLLAQLQIKDDRLIACLIAWLKDPDPNWQIIAAETVRKLRLKMDEFIEPLIQIASTHSDPEIREDSLTALQSYNFKDPKQIGSLMAIALKDPSQLVRYKAMYALSGSEVKDEKMVKFLVSALADQSPLVRSSVLRAIGDLGIKDERLVAPLLQSLNDHDDGVQRAATIAIALLKMKDFHPAIVKLLLKQDPRTLPPAIILTGELQIKNPKGIKALLLLLGHEDAEIRGLASWALTRLNIADEMRLKIIRDMSSKDPDPKVRASATKALKTLFHATAHDLPPFPGSEDGK